MLMIIQADLEFFEREGGGGLQPFMITFVLHSVRKGGIDLFLVKFSDLGGGGGAETLRTVGIEQAMVTMHFYHTNCR